MLDDYLVQTCYLVTETRNEYGDYVQGITTELACRFRYIDTVRRESNKEVNDSDAMLWLTASAPIVNGSVILYDSAYYQIERINKARRLGEDEVQFLKCDLRTIDLALS